MSFSLVIEQLVHTSTPLSVTLVPVCQAERVEA